MKNILTKILDYHRFFGASREAPKIFCIGMNKTGTTSLNQVFIDMEFKVGDQRSAEKLLRAYVQKNYDPIIKYCRTAQVFQDVPFSLPETYIHLDQHFPNSKFILSVRDSAEQWYKSITTFHAKKFGCGEQPSSQQLMEATYVYKGWAWESMVACFNVEESAPYDMAKLKGTYNAHNRNVIDYFKNRPNDLLVVNLAEKNSLEQFVKFVGIKTEINSFPWKNRTQ